MSSLAMDAASMPPEASELLLRSSTSVSGVLAVFFFDSMARERNRQFSVQLQFSFMRAGCRL